MIVGVTVYTPTQIQNQSHVIAMFESGAGVEVIENRGHMTARVYLPMTFLVRSVYNAGRILSAPFFGCKICILRQFFTFAEPNKRVVWQLERSN